MNVLVIAWVAGRDHLRRGAMLAELVVAMLAAAVLLQGLGRPVPAAYVGMTIGIVACLMPAVSASLVAARAADMRGEVFLIRAGRSAYYLAVVLTALVAGSFWVSTFGGVFYLVGAEAAPAHVWQAVAVAGLLNALLVVALFTTLSSLCGRPAEAMAGVALIILGLNSSWAQDLGLPFTQYLEYLVPPLMYNVKAAVAGRWPEVVRSLVYMVALIAIGMLRFVRREFHRA